MSSSEEAAPETLSLLEARFRRIEFVLNGDNYRRDDSTKKDTGSAAVRLRNLERSLQSLASTSPNVSNILDLQKKHPNLFHEISSKDSPPTIPASSLASLVLAHTDIYTSTAVRLTQLQDFSVPDAAVAAKLINLQPRIEQARARQQAQAKEVAELRARSARAVEAWYEGGVLGMDGQWADWEERLRDAEILVRRKEAAKKREEGVV